jgi:ketosteroid isomerase-like protein
MTHNTKAEHREMDALANRFFNAIERADFDAVKQIYSPDVEYWVNVRDESRGLDAVLELVKQFSLKVKNMHYDIESREFFPGGFVQRCRVTGELSSGEGLSVPVCLVIHIEEGRISKLYEYLDAASIMHVLS